MDTFPLMDLPNELVQRVIDLAEPGDIESFAICSKTVYALAKDSIRRHSDLKKKYSFVVLGDDPDADEEHRRSYEHHDMRSPAFLTAILDGKEVVYYPQKLYLYPLLTASESGEGGNPGAYDPSLLDQAQILGTKILNNWYKVIQSCDLILQAEKTEWCEALYQPDLKIRAAAVILMLFANIRHLLMSNISSDEYPEWLWSIIERIVMANRDGNSIPSDNAMALSKVEHFTFDIIYNGGEENFEIFTLFAMLPSMQFLDGYGIRGCYAERRDRSEYARSINIPMYSSSVTKLKMIHSSVDPESLEPFLASILNLQEFEYHHRTNILGTPYQPRKIVELLIKYAGASLIALDLSAERDWCAGWHEEEQSMGSLQSLTALKSVRADDSLFQKQDWDSSSGAEALIERLIDILPKTTEIVSLIQCWYGPEGFSLFQDLVEKKHEYLPVLKEIWCESEVFQSPDLLSKSLMESLKTVGITSGYILSP